MPFEMQESKGKILLYAALAEVPILAGGIYQFFVTDNPIWIIGAVVLGAVIFTIPAVLRVKKIQGRDDASR